MRPIIHVAATSEDEVFRSALVQAMSAEIGRVAPMLGLKEDDVAEVCEIPFEDVPDASSLSPDALIVSILPPMGVSLPRDVATRLESHFAHESTEGDRILPVCSEPGREAVPEPLGRLVAAHVHDVTDVTAIERLVRRALIMMNLCLTGGSSIFISYRTVDGAPAAAALTTRLQERGYRIWRDENRDDDDLPLIKFGSPVQRTIREAIALHAFVLLVDTPKAPESGWVREEVSFSLAMMLPILPVVIAADPLEPGSRFNSVGRFAYAEMGADAIAPLTADAEVLRHLDDIEKRIVQVVTGHGRTRRHVLTQTREAFESAGYRYLDLSPDELLFMAERSLEDHRTPGLVFRMLVQCCPYRRIPDPFVPRLRALFDHHNRNTLLRYQYVVLMHNAAAPRPEYATIIGGDSHLLLLDPTDLVDVFTKHGFAPLADQPSAP